MLRRSRKFAEELLTRTKLEELDLKIQRRWTNFIDFLDKDQNDQTLEELLCDHGQWAISPWAWGSTIESIAFYACVGKLKMPLLLPNNMRTRNKWKNPAFRDISGGENSLVFRLATRNFTIPVLWRHDNFHLIYEFRKDKRWIHNFIVFRSILLLFFRFDSNHIFFLFPSFFCRSLTP